MRPRLWVALAVLGGALCVSGCSSAYVPEGAAPGVRVNSPQAPYARVRMNTVNIIDKSLQRWDVTTHRPFWAQIFGGGRKEKDKYGKIAVESNNARRTPTGTLEVWAVLRNRTDYALQVEGRTQFFDSSEAPVEGPTAWQRVHLPPNSVGNYKEYSTAIEGISYYYVEIREGR